MPLSFYPDEIIRMKPTSKLDMSSMSRIVVSSAMPDWLRRLFRMALMGRLLISFLIDIY
jgi:hypothetical protein